MVYPIAPLLDLEFQRLSEQCRRTLERIFILNDHDMDGALNDHELNEFQEKFFEWYNEYGLTLHGFLFLQQHWIEKWHHDSTWIMLRKFSYNDDIELKMDNIPVVSRRLMIRRKKIEEDHERKKLELANEHERNKTDLDPFSAFTCEQQGPILLIASLPQL
ncbi:mitochondrial Rho GTPase 2-like protein [Tanacetum coccineum]